MDDTVADARATRQGTRRYARLDENRPRRELAAEAPMPVRPMPIAAPSAPAEAFLQIDVRQLIGHVTRNARKILLCGVAGAVLALGIGFLVPAKYTVSTEILVDPTNLKVVDDDIYAVNDQRDALALNVESKMRMLASRNVLESVVDELQLADDREFVPPPGLFDIGALTGLGTPNPPELVALQTLGQQVKARRDERSFVVTLEVTSEGAGKSVAIAQSIFSAFERELRRADSAGAGQAADALDARLAQLRQDVTDAENASETFRRISGLQDSGGQLISAQQMSQLNSQLAEARRALTEAKTRYEDLSPGGQRALDSSSAQASTTLTNLLAQQSAARQELDTLSRTAGPRHPNFRAAESRVATLSTQVDAEVTRVVAVARTDYEQAQAVVTTLEASLVAAQFDVSQDNASQVHLRGLERDAAAKAAIYETFMARARQMTEREQIDSTNVQVISAPVEPLERSWPPRNLYLLILGAAFGIAVGAAVALIAGATGWRWRRRPATPSAPRRA